MTLPEGSTSEPQGEKPQVMVVDDTAGASADLVQTIEAVAGTVVVWTDPLELLINSRDCTQCRWLFVNRRLPGVMKQLKKITECLETAVILFNVDNPAPCPIEPSASDFCQLGDSPSHNEIKLAIELSQYKKQLKNRYQKPMGLYACAFSCIGEYIISLDTRGNITRLNDATLSLFQLGADQAVGRPWYSLLKARRDLSAQHAQQFISAAITTHAITKIQPIALEISKSVSLLVDGIIGPINPSSGEEGVVIILRKLTNLGRLPELLRESGSTKNVNTASPQVSGLLLFSPDQLNYINLQYGRHTGDNVLLEIGDLLKSTLRPTDLPTHYGGASFLVLFAGSSKAQIDNLVAILWKKLSDNRYHDGTVTLSFSFGLAVNNELVSYSPVELFYYANYALSQAQDLGGDQIRCWQQRNALQQIGNFDRVSGNFSETGNNDYQKMLMLWSIQNNLTDQPCRQAFFETLLMQLNCGFNLHNSAYFTLTEKGPVFFTGMSDAHQPLDKMAVTLTELQREFAREVASAKQQEVVFTSILGENIEILVVIQSRHKPDGLLWLACQTELSLDAKDRQMLSNIAQFISARLDGLKHEAVRSATKQPISDQPNGIDLWYSSPQMNEQNSYVEKVAPTSATVLITGESGTGKELLAKSIHLRSKRKNKPFVIFDCAAVVDSLIESELFGHTKGAFTGAGSKTKGCIEQAHEGTLFLDEVGELPIETQVKLLRFVQEKQYTVVGSTRLISVDVRLIAATNVDLQEQIKKGLFREDLYYRLNVFNIQSVPLRQRGQDVSLLANRYLALYAKEYDKQLTGFSEAAEQAMAEYSWPGNVRELKNLLHKAVILCQTQLLDCCDLGLYPFHSLNNHHEANTSEQSTPPSDAVATKTKDVVKTIRENPTVIVEDLDQNSDVDDWLQLVNTCINMASYPQTIAIAPWLENRLFKISLDRAGKVALQAANDLGIAESSFRRKWKKLRHLSPPSNIQLRISCKQLVRELLDDKNVGNKSDAMTLQLIRVCKLLGLPVSTGAKLLGVSEPTLRKRYHEFQ